MKSYRSLLVLIICLSLVSCKAELTRRYKSMSVQESLKNGPHVRVSNFITDVARSKNNPVVMQLSADGQAQLVESIGSKCKTADDLYKYLGKGFPGGPSIGEISRTHFTVRIIFSIQKIENQYNPANRITRIELNLSDLPEKLRFAKWDKFETEYGEADLGKISLTKSGSIGARLSPTLSGSVVGVGEIGTSVAREKTEEVSLKQRYISLTGALSPRKVNLIQEGVTGLDLEGNASIDLTIEFNPKIIETHKVFKFSALNTSSGPKQSEDINFQLINLRIPELNLINSLTNGIQCSLSGKYVLRHVVDGHQTITEGDDSVIFIRGKIKTIPANIELLPKHELKQLRARYYFYSSPSLGKQLAIDLPGKTNCPLDFASYDEAESFLSWLVETQSTKVSDHQLKMSGVPLAKREISNLRIDVRP